MSVAHVTTKGQADRCPWFVLQPEDMLMSVGQAAVLSGSMVSLQAASSWPVLLPETIWKFMNCAA